MNQPPPTEKQTGKRIVSKGAYVEAQAQRAAANALALGFGGLAVICGFIVLGFLFVCLACLTGWGGDRSIAAAAICLGIVVVFLAGAFTFGILAYETNKQATKIDPGVPLTRANTADLPAPDSLVRASEEPVQEQQAVLLRAATEASERHEEQLVRPVHE